METDFDLDESIGYLLELTERTLKRELIKRFHEHKIDITPNQWVILYRLWKQEGITQAELSEKTFKDKANITRILDVMVKKGFVQRITDKNDRRIFKIFLTEKAKNLKPVLFPIVSHHIERATKGIKKESIHEAMEVLRKMCDNFS